MGDQPYVRSHQKTEKILLDAVKALRAHPEKYREVHKALREAKTDEERVHRLIQYATTDRQLTSLLPAATVGTGTGGGEENLIWTTVTVTTVFIPASAY